MMQTSEEIRMHLDLLRKSNTQNLRKLVALVRTGSLIDSYRKIVSDVIRAKKTVVCTSDEDAIRWGLAEMHGAKAMKKRRYYAAHLRMFEEETGYIFSEATKFLAAVAASSASNAKSPDYMDAAGFQLHRALWKLLTDADRLVKLARNEFGHEQKPFADQPFSHYYEIFQATNTSLYGEFSGLAFADYQPIAQISSLRTAIEIRLRSAFDVFFVERSCGVYKPVDLNVLIRAIKAHQQKVSAIDIDDVDKIYRWSNRYLHGARRDYAWTVGFCLRVLKPFFKGAPGGPGFDVHSGIYLSLETWREIRKACEDAVQAQPRGFLSWLLRRRSLRWKLPEEDTGKVTCLFRKQNDERQAR